MPRSRSGSRPSSRPASRPVSTVLNAMALSPECMELGQKLITKLTSFTEGQENFDICRDFLVSNLLYHNCLDPHLRDIEKRLEGIREKWIINAERANADRLGDVIRNLNSDPTFQLHHEQSDIKARLLSLLLHLSNSASVATGQPEIEPLQLPRREKVQNRKTSEDKLEEVLKMLREGEDSHRSPLESDDFSDWSSSSEEDFQVKEISSQDVNSDKKLRPVYLPGCVVELKPPVPVSSIRGKKLEVKVQTSDDWMRENILPPYWLEETDARNKFPLVVPSENDSASLLRALEKFDFQRGLLPPELVKVSEYQILRECLWMLTNPLCQSSPLFIFDDSEMNFRANAKVAILSLSSQSLQSFLSTFCSALTSLHRLVYFTSRVFDRRTDDNIDNVRVDDARTPLPPFTFEAYAEGLDRILRLFSSEILRIEDVVCKRKFTFTLMNLRESLSDWFDLFETLAHFHKTYVNDCSKSNWQKSIILIAGLHDYLNRVFKPVEYCFFVELFLRSIVPYFRIMSVWITQGRLEDWRNEFVFAKNPKFDGKAVKRKLNDDDLSAEDNFWSAGFIVQSYEDTLESAHLKVPGLLARTLAKILTCGKSIEILARLTKEGILPPSDAMSLKDLPPASKFYDEFLTNLKKRLEHFKSPGGHLARDNPSTLNDSGISAQNSGEILGEFVNHVDDLDPHLVAAFECMLSDIQVPAEPTAKDFEPEPKFFILSEYNLDPMIPLNLRLEESLAPVVDKHAEVACGQILSLFTTTLKLKEHLATLRSVFLFEAGDLMIDFTTEVFSRFESLLSSREDPEFANKSFSERRSDFLLDELTLTLFLHDCLGKRSSSFSDRIHGFRVDLDNETMDRCAAEETWAMVNCLTVSYAVEWPLNIILSESVMCRYNKIFVFLLKVKQALWQLQQIQAKELIAAVQQFELKSVESDSDSDDGAETAENSKIHRILLLKSWLLNFVSTIHSYFMTRVVHSTEFELREELSRCSDLDEIIATHDRYIQKVFDRCFLHPSAQILLEAVVKALKICSEFYDRCLSFVRVYSPLDEESFYESQMPKRSKYVIDVASLTRIESEYAFLHQFLASTLESMVQERNVPHLEGLASALVHSCPSVAIS